MEENESIGRIIKIEDGEMLISMKRDSACGSCESCAAGCDSKEHIVKACLLYTSDAADDQSTV